MKYYKAPMTILSSILLLALFFLPVSAKEDDRNAYNMDINILSKTDNDFPLIDNIASTYSVNCSLKDTIHNIPVYFLNTATKQQINTSYMAGLLSEAENLANDVDQQELIILEDDAIYIYRKDMDNQEYIIIQDYEPTIMEAVKPGLQPKYGLPTNLSNGIGAKAVTYSSSCDEFHATVATTVPNYSGSTEEKVCFYNYLGFTNSAYESDLGLMWDCRTDSLGWEPYFLIHENSTNYEYYFKTTLDNNLTGWAATGNRYRANASYPATLTINKNYIYYRTSRIYLYISGTTIDGTTGSTTMIGGVGISGSTPYKVVTTIASKNESVYPIYSGSSINSVFSAIAFRYNPNSSTFQDIPVTTFSSVLYDNATISFDSPTSTLYYSVLQP